MLNITRYVLAAIAGLIILLLAIILSNNAVTSRLESISRTLNREAERNERARERATLDERIDSVEDSLADLEKQTKTYAEGTSADWTALTARVKSLEDASQQTAVKLAELETALNANQQAYDRLVAELAKLSAARPNIVSMDLHLSLPADGEYHAMVNIANPPITAGVGYVLDRDHNILVGQPDQFLGGVSRPVMKQLQYLVSKGDLESGVVKIEHFVARKGADEDTAVQTASIPFKQLLEEGRAELKLANDATLIVTCRLGAGITPTF